MNFIDIHIFGIAVLIHCGFRTTLDQKATKLKVANNTIFMYLN